MKAQASLFIVGLVTLMSLVSVINCSVGTSPATSNSNNFYDFSCNADTYTPTWTSFATIWTLINVFVISISCIVYLMFMCFSKFVNAMTTS
ncbi:envelope glycoprotein N [Vespertilionid gammaherpesvirus 1]|uniref:Envelope glycoprotein N n=1 Tax=Vespertilionid gammaherpesvirus 1 TaxID=2560830 RepID=A0A0X9WR32_9GAMA|nr:envelope glycoprotein N [Myotis gammaherpesvirus 8]AMA67409.1 envelope glycoprotein N [Vespertilionid gammaherpesvirus 1]